jgi:cell division protein FtsI/penicillin-binding protein 2
MNYFKNHNYDEFISEKRIRALEGAVFLFIAIVVGRLFYLQVLEHDKYIALAQRQGQSLQVVSPERGEIFAQADNKSEDNLYSLAVNQIFYQVYVDPEKVTRPKNIADLFVTIFSLSEADILPKLEKTGDNYELLVKKASQEQIDKLQLSLEQLLQEANADKAKKTKLIAWEFIGKKKFYVFILTKKWVRRCLVF